MSAYQSRNLKKALGEFLKAVLNGVIDPGSYLLVESFDRMSRDYASKAVRVNGKKKRKPLDPIKDYYPAAVDPDLFHQGRKSS